MPSDRSPDDAMPSMYTSPLAAMLALVAVLVPICVALYIETGAAVAAAPALATVLGLAGWGTHRARARHAARAAAPSFGALQAYVAAIVVLIAQYTEEWLGHLPRVLVRLFPSTFPAGVAYDDQRLVAVFPLASSALFVLGALAYHHRLAIGEGAAWILFTWAVVGGAAIVVDPFVAGVGARYVPGMLVAPLAIACGAYGLRRLAADAS